MTSAGTTTLGYDYKGRVASISGPGGSNSFAYNGLDTRVGKVDSAGTSVYRRDGAEVTGDVLSDGSAVYTPGVSQRRSGTTSYDLMDQLGTAVKQTNGSTSMTATRTYDAFGMLVASSGAPVGPFGFASAHGYQEDNDSGLKLLGHRYYDPSTGRFLTRDTAKDGRNWYGYCDGNPNSFSDPNGESRIEIRYRDVTLGQRHSYIVIIDNDPSSPSYGKEYIIEGGPEHSTGVQGDPGDIEVFGRYSHERTDGDTNERVVIKNDRTPFATDVDMAKQIVDQMNEQSANYKPLRANSNSVSGVILSKLGLPIPWLPNAPGLRNNPWPYIKAPVRRGPPIRGGPWGHGRPR